jgi:hypothetical protein
MMKPSLWLLMCVVKCIILYLSMNYCHLLPKQVINYKVPNVKRLDLPSLNTCSSKMETHGVSMTPYI